MFEYSNLLQLARLQHVGKVSGATEDQGAAGRVQPGLLIAMSAICTWWER